MKENLIRIMDWDAYRKNLEDSIRNEGIWSLGDISEENPHEENIEKIQEELEYIVNGQYQSVIDEKFKVMGNDAINCFSEFYRNKEEIIDMIDWDEVYGDMENSINNERLWAAGSYEHGENADRLEHFLQCIDDGDYQPLLDYYGTEYFIKDYLYTEDELQQQRQKERITDINIYSGKDGKMYIRCKIDGEQQSAERLDKNDILSLDENTDRHELAAGYFKDALNKAEEQSHSMKR